MEPHVHPADAPTVGSSGVFADKANDTKVAADITATDLAVDLALEPGLPVFMASGQGSQKPGMGADLLDVDEVAATFALASEVAGRDLAELVKTASADELNDTRNAQMVIAALSIGIGRALEARGVRPAAVLGFSLGQMSALALAGMITDKAAFELIERRSTFMAAAVKAHPGAMSALLKGTIEQVEATVQQAAQGETLVIANYNCPGQTVISGTPEAVARAEEAWRERGLRSSRLATAGAFHSPLMSDATQPFASYLETVEFSEPVVPLINNVDAAPLCAARAGEMLVAHLTGPVRFEESVRLLVNAGATSFVEVGFGGVLTGLVKRIDRTVDENLTYICVQDRKSFESYLEEA